jgi:predicted nuclease of predicted toxin-antitoxin system
MARATDLEMLGYARSTNAVVVTLDADFHAIMATSGERFPSVVRLRLESVRSMALALIVAEVVSKLANELESGALVTVDARTIRFRLLPISG